MDNTDAIIVTTAAINDYSNIVRMCTSERMTDKKEGDKTMKDITQPGELERTYIYRDYFVTRAFPSGYYSTRTSQGRLMADTQQGIKKQINESIEKMKEIK